MKTIKVELTIEQDDGRQITKTLISEEAEKWQKWVDGVCVLAWTHGENPPWSELHWIVREAED